jgi:hypothetical protein
VVTAVCSSWFSLAHFAALREKNIPGFGYAGLGAVDNNSGKRVL